MYERVLLFAAISAWAALWMCMGTLRFLGLEVPGIGGFVLPDEANDVFGSATLAATFDVIHVGFRVLGIFQIGVALLFVAALVPSRQADPQDRAVRACGYAMVVLGLALGFDGMGSASGSLALYATVFVLLAASALFFSMQRVSSRALEENQVFTWAQRQAVLDETLERLARRERPNEYPPSCRTSSPTSPASR